MQCRFGRKFRHGNGILDKEWCLPLTVRRDSIDGAGDSEVLRVAETSIPYLTSQCNLRLLHANSLSFLPFKRRVSRLNCFHFSCLKGFCCYLLSNLGCLWFLGCLSERNVFQVQNHPPVTCLCLIHSVMLLRGAFDIDGCTSIVVAFPNPRIQLTITGWHQLCSFECVYVVTSLFVSLSLSLWCSKISNAGCREIPSMSAVKH